MLWKDGENIENNIYFCYYRDNMQKIPMHIYVDPETAQFYKEYAKKKSTSFTVLIKDLLEKNKKQIQNKKQQVDKNKYSLFLQTIKKIQKQFAQTPYYHPELTDDQLLYGK